MIVADTHAWIYYLLNKLPSKANEIFISAESGKETIAIPSICLVECTHLIETGKITTTYKELFSRLEVSNNFIVVPLTLEIIKSIPEFKLGEMHDRIIVATAKYLKSSLVTKDKEIIKSQLVQSIWN